MLKRILSVPWVRLLVNDNMFQVSGHAVTNTDDAKLDPFSVREREREDSHKQSEGLGSVVWIYKIGLK